VDGEGWKRMKADGELKEIHSLDVCRTTGKLTDDEWRKLVTCQAIYFPAFTLETLGWGGGGGYNPFP
jgi:hypothetical protein